MSEINIGVVGGGQLGRMMIEGAPAGYRFYTAEATPNCPAAQVGAEQIEGAIDDPETIQSLADVSDILTWEVEHVAAEKLVELAEAGHDVQPSPSSLLIIKDKLLQHQHYQRHGLPVANFMPISNADELQAAQDRFGDIIVKTRTSGFDGRGNILPDNQGWDDIHDYFGGKFGNGVELYAEQIFDFEKELAVLVARSRSGELAVYPVVETIHVDSQCHTVLSPAPIDPDVRAAAEELGKETVATFKGAGVYAVEMFMGKSGSLALNEVAPRVHNSGHLTIEANQTSQFRQHLLAITGQALGSTEQITPAAVMVNILGDRNGPANLGGKVEAEALPNTFVHIYGKADTKKARKMGHLTTLGANLDEALRIATQARSIISI